MSSYLYETHLHTSQASACGRSEGKDYISKYIDHGFDGIIVTDHFFRGNCAIDRALPWREKIHRFCQGYEDARNEGEKRGFPVFFGWEENFNGDEYLIYGLDEQWLMDHPELENCSRLTQYQLVREGGGCVVQAHPFRARSYISTIHLSMGCVDGIEGVNAGNDAAWNGLAMVYGRQLGVPVTAGSDNHFAGSMRKENLAGVVLDRPLKGIHDYVDIILNKEKIGIHADESLMPKMDLKRIDLPVELRDRNDQVIGGDICRFLRDGKL